MDQGIVAIILGILTFAGTFVTVKYKDYWKNKPKKLDPLQLFINRYEEDIRDLKSEVKNAKKVADEALALVKQKDEEISKLQRQISNEKAKYTRLLRRFNTLKAKVEQEAKKRRE